jgi:patatin-like phospholipase/acyl hydrolase
MVYRVLSIDGGGIRGVYSLKLLNYIEEEVDKDFTKKIDCFSGTSTGGLIATCLNLGYSPKTLLFYYKHFSEFAFPVNKNGGAKYHIHRLRFLLRAIISKNLNFSELKKDLVIPTCKLFDLEKGGWKEQIYDTFASFEENVIDVAIRSASAPIYFPSYQGHIDGGISAINPSMITYCRLIDKGFGAKDKDSIRLLSLGTGINPAGLKGDINWGREDWMSANHLLVELFMDLGAQAPHYPMQQILKDQYRRINSNLLENVPIDDVTKIEVLVESARAFKENEKESWDEHIRWIKEQYLEIK